MTRPKKNESVSYLTDEALRETGLAVEDVGAGLSGYRSLSIELVGINIKRPKDPGGEFLAVVKGLDADGLPVVAFHSAYTLGELFRGLSGRVRNGTLKWREDQYMQ